MTPWAVLSRLLIEHKFHRDSHHWGPEQAGAQSPESPHPLSLPCSWPSPRVTPSHSQRQTPKWGCTWAPMVLSLGKERLLCPLLTATPEFLHPQRGLCPLQTSLDAAPSAACPTHCGRVCRPHKSFLS